MKKKQAVQNSRGKKIALGIALGSAAIATIIFAAQHRASDGRTPVSPSATPTTTPSPKPTSYGPGNNTPAPTPTSSTSGNKTSTAPANTMPEPEGSFLSSPNITLSSANTVEESTCKTAPGVKCTIVVHSSSGAVVAEILAPEVDDSGGHLVYWDVKKYISTAGTYDVFANAASGNNSSKSKTYKLEVQL